MQVYVGPVTSAAQAQVVLPLVHSQGGVDGLGGGEGGGDAWKRGLGLLRRTAQPGAGPKNMDNDVLYYVLYRRLQ